MTDVALREFATIVLAAGRSQRMGLRNKLLMEIAGKPLLAHTLETVASLTLADFIVVTGHEHQQIADLTGGYPARVVFNTAYRDGLGASIACGADALCTRVSGVFIHLGDVPFVSASTFQALAHALVLDRDGKYQVFAPEFAGRRGHPILFRPELLPKLRELNGDEGARRLIGAAICQNVRVQDPYITRDFDNEAEFAALQRQE